MHDKLLAKGVLVSAEPPLYPVQFDSAGDEFLYSSLPMSWTLAGLLVF